MKRFTIVNNGYDIDEVNRFIDIVIGRLEKLNAENISLSTTVEELREQGKKANNVSNVDINKLEKAILAVQETSDKMKETAREEARVIVEEAKNNANAIIHEALVNAEKTEHERILLEKNVKLYKERIRLLTQSQLNLIDELDVVEIEDGIPE